MRFLHGSDLLPSRLECLLKGLKDLCFLLLIRLPDIRFQMPASLFHTCPDTVQKLFFSCFRVLFREITRLIHFAFTLNSNSVNPLSCYLIILYLFPFLLAVPVPSSSFLLLLLILYVFLFLHRLYPKFFSSTLSIPVVHSIYISLFIFSKVLMLFTN